MAKIAYLRTDFFKETVGGSFTHTGEVIEALRENNKVFLITSKKIPQIPVKQYVVENFGGMKNKPSALLYNIKLRGSCKAIFERERPDIIYHRYSGLISASVDLSKRFKIPLFLEFNGSEVWVAKNWYRSIPFKGVGIGVLEKIETRNLENATKIFVVSKVLKDCLIKEGIDGGKIIVNPNGVNTEKFTPKIKPKFRTKTINVGFVGTFGKWHGVDTLVKSVLPTVKKNKNIRFYLIGDGELRGFAEDYIKKNKLEEYVNFLGLIDHEKLPSYLSSMDILVSPTKQLKDIEFFGSPTKLFEYMAMGKAIIATSVGQLKDIIKNGKNGILIEPDDWKGLSKNILKLSDNKRLRDRLGRNARKDAVEKHSWKRNAERILSELKCVV